MKKIEKVFYVADDGKEFDDEYECREYEASMGVRNCISEIITYCSERECTSLDCIFCGKNGCIFAGAGVVPIDWENFMR